MKVAVVTPYYETPIDWLGQCHRSVKAQTHPCTHFLVSDGKPEEVVEHYDAHHVRLPGPHQDVGNTGRAIGAILAQRQGFDAICFLDADNWYRPDHVASLVALQRRTGAAVCSSSRMIHHLDGALLGACKEVDGEVFVDTNCLLLTRPAFPDRPPTVIAVHAFFRGVVGTRRAQRAVLRLGQVERLSDGHQAAVGAALARCPVA
jgi:glycosyltransferase involved in cell wall biosynthesis